MLKTSDVLIVRVNMVVQLGNGSVFGLITVLCA